MSATATPPPMAPSGLAGGAGLRPAGVFLGAAIVAGASYWLSRQNYLLFHTLAELFSIVIVGCIFTIAWTAREQLPGGYSWFLGLTLPFIALVDCVHLIVYKDMDIVAVHGADPSAQLWIGARYLQALTMLAAPLFVRRKAYAAPAMTVYAVAVSVLLLAIFRWNVFPTCFVDDPSGIGGHLTAFKRYSEYIISALFLGALLFLRRRRDHFAPEVLFWLQWSILATIASELMFTLYADVYGISNMLGHLLKVLAFWFIYKAIVEKGIRRPFDLLFREIGRKTDDLERHQAKLETRVEERTLELAALNTTLREEIAERIKVQGALEQSERKLRGIFDRTFQFIALLAPDGSVSDINRTALEAIQVKREEVVGRPLWETPLWPAAHSAVRRLKRAVRAAVRGEFVRFEVGFSAPSGETATLDFSLKSIRDSAQGASMLLAEGRDITERRRLEKEVLEIANRERRQVGQDLHDALGQSLTGLGFLAGSLRRDLEEQDLPQAADARKIESIVEETLATTRALARGLAPIDMGEDGLMIALDSFCRNVEGLYGIPCTFRAPGQVPISRPEVAECLYLIAREAVTNAVRHGHPNRIRVLLKQARARVFLTIRDDGTGLHQDPAAEEGMGLHIMRHRAASVGGICEVRRLRRGGTAVVCWVPLAAS